MGVMEQIGKGAFTTCYRQTNTKVLLKTTDPVKECMAHGWFPSSHLFPKVEYVGSKGDKRLYTMNYYHKRSSLKKSLKPSHWKDSQLLRAIMNEFNPFSIDKYSRYSHWYKVFSKIKKRSLREALIGALEALSNYGSDINFEISPRNVAVSPTGGLVLLDCFFMSSALKRVRG